MTSRAMGALYGAAAGAAGTVALDTVTYLDMVLRARPASHTPETTVERLAEAAHTHVPGDGDRRENRTVALGALTGIVAGVGMGALLGLARAAGWRPPTVIAAAVAAVGALAGTNGPMIALKVTDPRTWSTTDWVSDLVPHLAYAVVTRAALERLDP
ncbi:hypothetical protein [Streptomyces sp. NBC_01497]|uniref:hypothetical protein n=1 Tax=Streptomyces sp. NBC_01497 TaxID=2903885 RepID=UPI002E317489|nr:hypothetical protein [Streptomyces sp. NBC_01497]